MRTKLSMTTHPQGPAPNVDGGTVFRVESGDDSWVTVNESASDADSGQRPYEEIFASDDARPISESARYVFAVAIELDESVDIVAFNDWYDNTHVPVVATAGLTRGRRFRDTRHPRRFLAMYDMAEADTLESDAIARVRGFDHFAGHVHGIQRRVMRRRDSL